MSMTNAEWTPEARALWERISQHAFSDTECRTDFAHKLMQQQGWTRDQAQAAIEEYRRFCFLACIEPKFSAPSDQVDQVWHLHLTYTRDYWNVWCSEVLRTPLHHEPSRGGAVQLAHHRHHYAETLARYERWFGAPPEPWWPGTRERFRHPERFRHVDLESIWLFPRPRWPSGLTAALAILLVAFASTATALGIEGTVLDWEGPPFLKLYLMLMLVSIVAAIIWRRILRENNASMVSAATLKPLEVAYLADGATRCVDTATADLLRQEVIAFDSAKNQFVIKQEGANLTPELAGLHRVIKNDGRADQVLKLGAHLFDGIRKKLQQQGLLLDDGSAWRAALVPAVLPAAVLMLGLLKVWIGIERERPIVFLVLLSGAMIVVTLMFLARKPARSRSGERTLRELRRVHARAARAPRDMELPIAVALLGTVAMSGTAWASYHEMRAPPSSSSSGDSGGSSSDGGSSDSGGGGCGGCGGGGGD
jgi:uncharacterized protein (TIGR04222 family)